MRYFIREAIFFSLLILILPFSCGNKKPESFESDWQKFKSLPQLKHANIGLIIKDAVTGADIYEYNADKLFLPASVYKIITTSYALEKLGAQYTFKTKVFFNGTIDAVNHTLNGDIYIEGGGDPTLGSKFFKNINKDIIAETISALKKRNISNITGNIIVSDAIYGTQRAPSTWSWQDVANYYASGAAGLSYADNMYNLYFDTSVGYGEKVKLLRSEPEMNNLTFINEVTAYSGKEDLSYIHGSEYTQLRYIRGKLPAGKSEYKIKGAMTNPPLFMGNKLFNEMNKSGINVRGEIKLIRSSVPASAQQLLVIKSPILRYILRSTNHSSINLYAEHLLRQPLAEQVAGQGIDEALEDMRSFWKSKGLYHDALQYCDGAGLSLADRISPKHLADVLYYMKNKSANSSVFIQSLPLAGKEGTLRKFLNNSKAKEHFQLKSGSFTGIRSYAGYGTTASGKKIIMVLMVNDFSGNTYSLRNKMAKVYESAYLYI